MATGPGMLIREAEWSFWEGFLARRALVSSKMYEGGHRMRSEIKHNKEMHCCRSEAVIKAD